MDLGGSRLHSEQVGEVTANDGQFFNELARHHCAGSHVVGLHHLRFRADRHLLVSRPDLQLEILPQRGLHAEARRFDLRLFEPCHLHGDVVVAGFHVNEHVVANRAGFRAVRN